MDGRCQNVTNHTNKGLSLHSSLRGPRGRHERWQIHTSTQTNQCDLKSASPTFCLLCSCLMCPLPVCVSLSLRTMWWTSVLKSWTTPRLPWKTQRWTLGTDQTPSMSAGQSLQWWPSLLLSAITILQFRIFLIQVSQENYPSIQSCTYTCHAMIDSCQDGSMTCLLHLLGEL